MATILTEIDLQSRIYEGFISKITIAKDGCWLFRNKRGIYPTLSSPLLSRRTSGHRFSFEIYKGAIPVGMHIDHLCMEPSCCNPDHLEAVTPKENCVRYHRAKREGVAKVKTHIPLPKGQHTHCRSGHLYSEVGVYVCKGIRQCRLCRKLRDKERQPRIRK